MYNPFLEDFIALGFLFILGFVFHYFQKICQRDYNKAKEDFNVFLTENKQYTEWDYNIKKNKMDMRNTRKWCSLFFKYLCFILSISGLITLLIKR